VLAADGVLFIAVTERPIRASGCYHGRDSTKKSCGRLSTRFPTVIHSFERFRTDSSEGIRTAVVGAAARLLTERQAANGNVGALDPIVCA